MIEYALENFLLRKQGFWEDERQPTEFFTCRSELEKSLGGIKVVPSDDRSSPGARIFHTIGWGWKNHLHYAAVIRTSEFKQVLLAQRVKTTNNHEILKIYERQVQDAYKHLTMRFDLSSFDIELMLYLVNERSGELERLKIISLPKKSLSE